MEGRDIGSAVFPQTPYKFYIDASLEVRAQRRQAQAAAEHDEIAARDRTDSTRRTSPLIIAEDAHVIDSSRLTIDGVVGEIIGRLKLKGLLAPRCSPSPRTMNPTYWFFLRLAQFIAQACFSLEVIGRENLPG